MDIKSLFKRKSYIPPLASIGDSYSSGRIREFKSKEEQLNANLGWVYLGADTRARRCAGVEVMLWDKKTDKQVEEHALLDLLKRPNAIHSGKQLRIMYHTYKALTGEFYALKSEEVDRDGVPLAIHIMPSHLAQFHLGKQMDTSYVSYGSHKYDIAQVLRDIEPDPSSPYYGRGVVAAAAGAIDSDMSSVEYNRQFFANSARPSTIINIKNTLEDKVLKRFKQEITALHTGTQNAGKPLILEGDLEVRPYMLTQKEMDYLESRKFGKDEILAMFKVSPGMVGMTEGVNRSNMDASDIIFAKNVVVDELDAYVGMLNNQLMPDKLSDKLEFRYENPVPEDKEHDLNMYDKGVGRWITPDEIREELNLPPANGAFDKVEPTLPTKELDEIKLAIKQLSESDDSKKKDNGRLYSTPSEREDLGTALTLWKSKALNEFEESFGVAARKVYDTFKADIQKNLNGMKKSFNKKGIDDIVPSKAKYVKLAITLFSPIYDELVKRDGAMAYLLVTGATDFDINDPDISDFIEMRTELVANSVNDTAQKEVRATLSQGLKDKESVAELSARLEEVLGLGAQAKAQRVARTESVRTSTESNIEAWKQSGVVAGKEWGAFEDNRTCPYCKALDGRIIGLTDNFFDKGDVFEAGGKVLKLDFEDVVGAPVHASCRCVLLPIIE